MRNKTRSNKKDTCAERFADADNLLNDFADELKTICTTWKELTLQQLLIVFPDINSVESDMIIHKEHLQPDVIPVLSVIFIFWRNRKYIQEIFFGLNELVKRFSHRLNLDIKKTFTDLIEINEQTITSVCYDRYQHYVETVKNIYSVNMLNLCVEFHRSKELVRFLDELSITDADNLLEAVNDWDETLISTKSVIDFVKLKTFFTRAYTSIEQLSSYKTELVFQDIAKCFDDIFKDNDFKNVIGLFQTCSESFAGIKHLYLELTNKEQSKRKCIIDIMSHSLLNFVKNLHAEHLFDVQLKSKNLTFNDLSELRDRARLIAHSKTQSNNADHNQETKLLESFIELVDVIENVLKILSSLYVAGFPNVNEIINSRMVTCNEGNYDELSHLHRTLNEKLKFWERTLCQMYEVYPELTYFSYEQFQTVEDFIYNVEIDKKHPGYHLLKYIGFEPALIQHNTLPHRSVDERERLENLGKALRTQRSVSDDFGENENVDIIHTVSTYHNLIYDSLVRIKNVFFVHSNLSVK